MDADPLLKDYLEELLRRLSRFFHFVHYKIQRKNNKRLYRISFKKTSSLLSTYLHVSTKSANSSLQMKYSIAYQEYFLEIWLLPLTEFYISQQGSSYLIGAYPQTTNNSGKIINTIPTPIQFLPKMFNKNISLKSNGEYIFKTGGYSIGKSPNTNEDAYFCTDTVIGVADGIGSLQRAFGISSQEFSSELMAKCEWLVKNSRKNFGKQEIKIKEIIKQAYNSLECGGSSTFLLASLSGRQMHVLNLGDCGLIVIRCNEYPKIVFQTTAKVHSFNTPYQISKKFSTAQLRRSSNERCDFDKSDDINDADEFLITTLPGDIAIMGSDGLWDNIYPEEILKIVQQYHAEPIQQLASIIGKIARIKSLNNTVTPFAEQLNKISKENKKYIGGKEDDITVVVARVERLYFG